MTERFRFNVPPYRKTHPDTWPTASQLPDAELVRRLNEAQRADQRDRRRPTWDEKKRNAVNVMIAELTSAAIQRGLIDPDEPLGPPE